MPWYFFAFAGVVVSSFTNILRKLVLSGKYKIDYYATSFLLSVVTCLVLGVYVAIVGFYMPPLSSFVWIFILNMGLGIIGLLTSQKGLSLLGVGEFTVLMTSSQVITWLLSIVLMGIGLSVLQGFGSVLIMTAIAIVFLKKDMLSNISVKGLIFTGLTALNYGFATLTDQIVYRHSDPASYMVIGFGLTAIVLAIARPNVVRTLRLVRPTMQGAQLIALGCMNGLALVLLFTGLKLVDNAPLFSGLSKVGIILSVVLGIVILRERANIARKLLGACLAAIGVFLMVI